jgi:hypothetical protein
LLALLALVEPAALADAGGGADAFDFPFDFISCFPMLGPSFTRPSFSQAVLAIGLVSKRCLWSRSAGSVEAYIIQP